MSKLNQLNISDVLFFDVEVVRNQQNLDPTTKEFGLYQHKIRDRETDKLHEPLEVIAHYNKFAGLKAIYHKIVCISVGAVKDDKVYLKSYTGNEKDIIDSFYKKMKEYSYISGFNCLSYDLPITRICALRYPEVLQHLIDKFDDSLKKVWNLDKVIDLMDAFRGTHFANVSLSEAAYHLNVFGKEGMDGSMVSDIFYKEGIDKISTYCKSDVFITMNLFQALRGEKSFTEFVDIDALQIEEKPLPLLERILKSEGKINKEDVEQIKDIASKLGVDEKIKALELIKIAFGENSKKKLHKEITSLFQ